MADWLSSMSQTFEFYEVDPKTWKDKTRLDTIESCKISRDISTNTLETASINTTSLMDECYIRVYLIVKQNNIRERFPLGTFLVQTPGNAFDGKRQSVSMDAYSPLLELKDTKPSVGFTVMKNQNIMNNACSLTKENVRAPVVEVSGITKTLSSNFVAEDDESWLEYISALMKNADYYYMLDELSRILFAPKQDTASLQPVWTYTDDNSSILYPDISDNYDLYGIPNTVEVIYSGQDSSGKQVNLYSKVVNDNPDSPTSTVARGREVLHRIVNPSISGYPDKVYLDIYAENVLKELNSIEHKLVYSHGYCPVRVGDCVRLNYRKAGITDIKARVISQDIECKSGCKVSETAVYTTNLWKE